MENLGWGLLVTVLGMGIVFGLLFVLWLLLTLVLRVERRREVAGPAGEDQAPGRAPGPAGEPALGPPGTEPMTGPPGEPAPPAAGSIRLVGAPDDLDPRLIAAVTVAILRHLETRRRQAAPAMRSYWPGSLLFASRWVAAGRTRQAQVWRRRAR